MVFLHLVLRAGVDENPGSYTLSGFAPVDKVKIDLVSLSVFPSLDIHMSAFCKVENVVSSSMPVANKSE
jgi:hypothetical protein